LQALSFATRATSARDHLQRLIASGIDPTAARERGQLELRSNTETYLRDGRFDVDRMLFLASLRERRSRSTRERR
jgi:hypothetical protein